LLGETPAQIITNVLPKFLEKLFHQAARSCRLSADPYSVRLASMTRFFFRILSPAVVFLLPCLLLFVPWAAAKEDSVWVVLGVHGSPKLAPQFMQAYADESAALTDEELKRERVDNRRPIVLWFERALPLELFHSITDPASFYIDVEERSGIPLTLIPAMLVDPVTSALQGEKIEKVLREIFDEHEARFVAEGGEKFVMPNVFKDWLLYLKQLRPVKAKYEKASYEAWLAILRSNLWAAIMGDSLIKGDIEAALESGVRYNILLHLSNSIRDRNLANQISLYHREHPQALHIVIRGSAHDRLAAFLNRERIQSRNIQRFDYRGSFSAADFFVNYESRPEVFTAAFRLGIEERDYASRDLIEQLATLYLLHQGIEVYYRSPFHAPLKALLGKLDSRDLGEWRDLMATPGGDIAKKSDVTWKWLTSKEPALGRQFPEAAAAVPVKKETKSKKTLIRFDGREWITAFEEENKVRYQRQFVPSGQTIYDWTELVAESYYSGTKTAEWIRKRARETKDSLSFACAAFYWKVLADDPADMIYEWSSSGCPGYEGQSELARIVSGSAGYYIFRYTIKGAPMPADRRKTWLRLIDEFEVP